jgi:hypothetical protein
MDKTRLLSIVLTVLATPALGAQFYIVQDVEQKRCSVAEQVPATDKYALVGDGAYGEQKVAQAEMNGLFACNPSTEREAGAPQERSAEPAKQ